MDTYSGLKIRETKMPMPDDACLVSKSLEGGFFKVIWYGPLAKAHLAPEGGDTIWLHATKIEELKRKLDENGRTA